MLTRFEWGAQNTDDLEDLEEEGDGRIQVRTIVVGEGDGARIECLSCHRIMKPNSLKAHLKTHAHERPHACDLCDARFTRRGDLERHIKVVHNKDRPFKCTKCHRAFGDKKNLRWHLSNHDRKLFHHCQVRHRYRISQWIPTHCIALTNSSNSVSTYCRNCTR